MRGISSWFVGIEKHTVCCIMYPLSENLQRQIDDENFFVEEDNI
jgi:hypothetical protein